MKKLFVLTFTCLCFFSTAVWAEGIKICNMTNSGTMSSPVRPTTIVFSVKNSSDSIVNSSVVSKKINNLILKPGQKIVLNSKDFPFILNSKKLFVNYKDTSGDMLLGIYNLSGDHIGIHNYGIDAVTSSYEPYYSTKSDNRGNIKEVDFYYANTFFSA